MLLQLLERTLARKDPSIATTLPVVDRPVRQGALVQSQPLCLYTLFGQWELGIDRKLCQTSATADHLDTRCRYFDPVIQNSNESVKAALYGDMLFI